MPTGFQYVFRSFVVAFTLIGLLSTAAPAFADGGKRNVNVNVEYEYENPMWTITKSSFYGGLFGLLVATAGLFITEFEMDPAIFGYCAGGGILLGAGVGAIEVALRPDPLEPATASMKGPEEVEKAYMFQVLSIDL